MNHADTRWLDRPPLLEVQSLAVRFGSDARPLDAVDNANLTIGRGETVCLVGESGSGKTVTALSVLRLGEYRDARIVRGDIRFDGRGLLGLSRGELERLRGRRIGMVFQEPMTAFDPLFTIGEQIIETIRRHEPVSRREAFERGVRLLERVHLPDARMRMGQIPQQLSGGMRQRAMIAMALACGPQLLIADEPTTALDVTIQAQILALLQELQREDGLSILLITHDLGVAAEVADRVVVMYAGRVVEQAPAEALYARPGHPYTRALLRSVVPPDSAPGSRLPAIAGSMPRLDALPGGCRFHPRCPLADARCAQEAPPLQPVAARDAGAREVACWHAFEAEPPARREPAVAAAPALARNPAATRLVDGVAEGAPLVELIGVHKHFASSQGLFARGPVVRALDGVSLQIRRGETFGLVGESGCGKSTLGRLLLQLDEPTSGELRYAGRPLHRLGRGDSGKTRRQLRREMQMIFQDPYSAIDPRWTVGDVIAEPLVAHGEHDAAARRERVEALLAQVGLDAGTRTRHVHSFSGGQRQRIGIARALALAPSFVLADEAVSALDLSVQAQVINLFAELREQYALTTLFIGHGLHVVRHVSQRIGVMYLGRLVEVAPADQLFRHPAHPYTAALIAAIPLAEPRRRNAVPGATGARRALPVGELPSPTAPPSGCHFHPRCPAATARCREHAPALAPIAVERQVACHFPLG